MDWKVELSPLVGKEKTAAGPAEIEHPLWRVIVQLPRGKTQVALLPYVGNKCLWMSYVLEKGDFYLNERQRTEIDEQALALAAQSKAEKTAASE